MQTLNWFSTHEKHFVRNENPLVQTCRKLGLSEFEFFCVAASRWGIDLQRIHDDYSQYITLGVQPLYVTDKLSK
jgi:hypothetical protein